MLKNILTFLARVVRSFYFRVILAFLLIIFLLASAVTISIFELDKVITNTSGRDKIVDSQNQLLSMRVALLEENLQISQFVLLNQYQGLADYNNRADKGFAKALAEYVASGEGDQQKAELIAKIREKKTQLDQIATNMANLLKDKWWVSATEILKGDFNTLAAELNNLLNDQTTALGTKAAALDISTAESEDNARQTLLWSGAATSAVALLLAIVLTLLLGRAIRKLEKGVAALAKGNLAARIKNPGNDELGRIAKNFNQMAEHLNLLIGNIQQKQQVGLNASQEVNSIVSQLSMAAGEQFSAASEQSVSINQIASSLEELRETARQIANRASQVADQADITLQSAAEVQTLALQTRQSGRIGQEQVQKSLESSYQVQAQVQDFSEVMGELSRQSRQIDDIIKLIKGIADQTHLLALNAAIECAGAGQYGARFKVVASEVKQLADRSLLATTEVSQVVNSVRTTINRLSETMVETSESVHSSVSRSEEVYRAITELNQTIEAMERRFAIIVNSMDEINQEVDSIRLTTHQQQSSTEQVTQTIRMIDGATRETAHSSQELADTARRLQELSVNMTHSLAA
jgi:methyl-accepting chemotaxis protein